ncbi:hypothetical protein Acor_10390 [Acrocarpospora corrugata]|uniref:Uncharacterized protein n=1 Tax=Acrocarpospora corrugata TaxID=35763 RepID=A0A5M3VQP9_9ACTN|nr:hypothetical protein Acor_10390 [Acrocarpospora corrugata]
MEMIPLSSPQILGITFILTPTAKTTPVQQRVENPAYRNHRARHSLRYPVCPTKSSGQAARIACWARRADEL